jgi:hypothetical protein
VLLVASAAAVAGSGAHAGPVSGDFCNANAGLSAGDHDKLLRFAAVVRETLTGADAPVALVARSGLDLSRVGQRYSHAGLSLRAHPQTAWAVRQLYVDCASGVPSLFDQGLAAFVLGTHDARSGFLSAVLLRGEAARALQAEALDEHRARALVAPDYSANAFAFATRYQNCNQWLAELMALAWSATPQPAARGAAQEALRALGYAPTVVEVGRPLIWFGAFIPWIHRDDHPAEDLAAARYRISLPPALDALARARDPQAERIEFCHAGTRIVVRRGWVPLADDCRAQAGDREIRLEADDRTAPPASPH